MAINKRKILESAQKHLQRGALDRALKDYQALLEADPRDTNVRLKIGDLHLRRGETNEAVGAYTRVGAQFMKDGFDAKAVAIYKQIAKIDPARVEVNEPLAELYQRMGLPSEAMGSLQAAADAHHKVGRKREALECLRRMASLDPSNTASRLKVAELLRQAKLEDEAIAEYEGVAGELERQGDAEGLVAILEKILELAPDRLGTAEQAARLHLRLGQAGRAEPFVRRLVDAQPDAPAGYELLAEVHRAAGRESELLDLYRRLAEMYRQRGDEDKAREIAQRFLPPSSFSAKGDTPTPVPPAETGVAADFGSEFEGTLEFDAEDLGAEELPEDLTAAEFSLEDSAVFKRGLLDPSAAPGPREADPPLEPRASQPPAPAPEGDPEQLFAEANVYLRYGKHDRAIAALETLVARDPRHRPALEKLGEAFATKGAAEPAVGAWLRAAELARAERDAEAHESLRSRIGSLDARAAQALPTLPSVAPAAPATAQASAPGEPDDRTFPDLEFEVEIDGGDEGAAAEAKLDLRPASEALAESVFDASEGAAKIAPARERTPAPDDESIPPHIAQELEEARFYRERGLLDEAERVYRRVLASVPGHAPALLGLGGIAASRGFERSSSSATPAELPTTAPGAARETGIRAARDPDADTLDPFADLDDDTPPAPLADAAAAPTVLEEVEPAAEIGADADRARRRFAPIPAETTSPELDEPNDGPAAPRKSDLPARGVASASDEYDLAAALSADFESGEPGPSGVATDEDGFLALFRDFKRGVEQTLGEADGEARYDLGIAYREMGLLEDALHEFRASLAAPARHLDSLHMLALCSLELGRARDAVAHLTQALTLPDVPAQQAALRFDLGRAHESLGEREPALEAYRSAGALDPAFPGLAARIAALEETGSATPAGAGDSYESFEDLLAEKGEEANGESAQPEASYESFEDVVASADEALQQQAAASEPEADAREGAADPEQEAPASPAPKPSRRKKISFF